MTEHYTDGPVTVHHGDCIEVMRDLADGSVDAVVTDPPYGIDFMGKSWDAPGRMLGVIAEGRERSEDGPLARGGTHTRGYADHDSRLFQAWCEQWAAEAFRLLKPGGHLLAFGGTRTFHRLAAGIEDAGFEIRDSIAWLYGSGFPKSLDVSKAIDRQLGAERPVTRPAAAPLRPGPTITWDTRDSAARERRDRPATREGTEWQGWGTALKPAFEPVVVARKPLAGTVASNVLAHGTGALNIEDCRVAGDMSSGTWGAKQSSSLGYHGGTAGSEYRTEQSPAGRWPANVALDASQAAALDEQSGISRAAAGPVTYSQQKSRRGASATVDQENDKGRREVVVEGYGDTGGASRFFYTAKAATSERPTVDGIAHPTVKPVDLMRWLVRLVTPKGGTVLEPFAGSGSTVEAAVLEGFRCVAIEREAEYLPLILQRIRKPHAVGLDFGDWDWEAGA